MMLYRVKIVLRRVKRFVDQCRVNGLSLGYIFCIHLPRLFLTLFYFKGAKWFNDRIFSPYLNRLLMKKFHQQQTIDKGGHYYVIVMPNTLHYLIPCLRLIPDDIPIFLIFNGAKSWERSVLQSLFKHRPSLRLMTLPFSSVNHGPVINLFFSVNQHDFGIIDHDLYIFDSDILRSKKLSDTQSMRALFKGVNGVTGMSYPHTFFLFFNTPIILNIMQRFKVDARIYHKVGQQVAEQLAKVGLSNGNHIKEYINYFDTLHVILGLSYAQELEVDYVESQQVFHLGGTSMGSQYSKDLFHMYMSMRFLELINDETLNAHYLPFLRPFTDSSCILDKLEKNKETIQMLATLDRLIEKLR